MSYFPNSFNCTGSSLSSTKITETAAISRHSPENTIA